MDTREYLFDILSQRSRFTQLLFEHPADKRTLIDELDVSRSTVDRGVRDLETADLIEYQNGQYRLTPYGRLVAEEYDDFTRRIQIAGELKPFFRWLSLDEFPFDLKLFADAKVVVSTSSDPYAPANRHADAMNDSRSLRAMVPAVGLNQLEVAHQNVLEDDQQQQVVVESEVVDTLRSKPHYEERIQPMLSQDSVTLYQYDGAIPYFIGIYDDLVHIGVGDGEGIPRALVETPNDAVRTEAIKLYEQYQSAATKLSHFGAEHTD
ncbi:helix-turn-helix transcriptional regulator [Halomicrococcus sp. NG-SE-24]|uniref:helix-turn-helix transcriptional regulator n=1 Tax=Halomicrococcus sp. NG-SE-24 TaxID=3436928 RepID=UPI003D952290